MTRFESSNQMSVPQIYECCQCAGSVSHLSGAPSKIKLVISVVKLCPAPGRSLQHVDGAELTHCPLIGWPGSRDRSSGLLLNKLTP